jgi:hypothetical protein
MRFHVESWGQPLRPHTVDLLSWGGRGECSCKDWQTRRGPRVKAGDREDVHCVHVAAARRYFLDGLLERMSREHAEE